MSAKTIKKTVLANGIRITTKAMPYLRSVSMGVWVNAGARDEALPENGLSHLIEHMIFKGTERRSAYDIAKEFDAIGGFSNAFTSFETTCYHAKVMDGHMASMIDILTDIFLNSVFDPDEFERERPVILQEIGMVEDNPEEHLHLLSGYNFWGDNPLGRSILGTRENVLRFDAETTRRFFNKLYQPERIVITAAGNLCHERLVECVAPAFESVKNGADLLAAREAPSTRAGLTLHPRGLEQQHICLTAPGIAIADPNRYAFSLLNTILGGNMSSRLFQEIREQRGLAYSVYSFVTSFEDTGMFGVYAGVDPANTRETIALILAALERIRSEPIDAQTLAGAKEFTKGSLLLASESNDNQMVRMAQNEINFGTHTPMDEIMAHIDGVTPEEIQALAARLFVPSTMAATLLGPLDDPGLIDDVLPRAAA